MNDRDSRLSEPKTSLAESRQTEAVNVHFHKSDYGEFKTFPDGVMVGFAKQIYLHRVETRDFERLAKELKAIIIIGEYRTGKTWRYFKTNIGLVGLTVFEVD